MSVEAQAVLTARIESAQIVAALLDAGYRDAEIVQANDQATVIRVTEKTAPDIQQIWIFRPFDQFRELHAGERTLLTASPQGEGPEIIKALAEVFGGYYRAEDLPHVRFDFFEGRDEYPRDPRNDLALAIQRTLPPEAALTLVKVLWEDRDNAEYIRDALTRYLEQA